ncbi:MAG: Sec-independent protein translocase protein TatB, partial [Acetobacteraceae bacterium]
MFNFAWSELAVIVAVALVLIGPKDMPAGIRAITGAIKKARRMASEFQGHVDDMVREADLGDVRDTLKEFRNLNVSGALERMVDPDGGLRGSFTDDPPAEAGADTEVESVDEFAVSDIPRPDDSDPPRDAEAPAFIPPAAALPAEGPDLALQAVAAPAFVPPAFVPSVSAPPASTPSASVPPIFVPPAFGPSASASSASAPSASAPPAPAPSDLAYPAVTPAACILPDHAAGGGASASGAMVDTACIL